MAKRRTDQRISTFLYFPFSVWLQILPKNAPDLQSKVPEIMQKTQTIHAYDIFETHVHHFFIIVEPLRIPYNQILTCKFRTGIVIPR